MAKFKVGDKVRIQMGTYPENYSAITISPDPDAFDRVLVIAEVANDNRSDVVPDYSLETLEGECVGYCDEVHLIAEKPAAPLIVQPALDKIEVALRILASIEAKLDGLDARLAAHETKANAVITINVDGAVQVAEKAVAEHFANACQEVSLPKPVAAENPWLYEFDEWMQVPIGSLVEVAFDEGSDEKFILDDNHVNYVKREGGLFEEGDESTMPLRLKALPDGPRLWGASAGMIALRVIR